MNPQIQNIDELEFAIFCIENTAISLHTDAKNVYTAWTQKGDILNRYIIPCFDILHTQSKEYIIEDILSVMREEGVII